MQVPAKINLYLNVTGRREDGYHYLDTLIVFTDICDEIEITASRDFSMEISGEFAHMVENDDKNIVACALKLMAEECGASANVAIKLVKNIPVGAGLGGGSADAAGALILLNDLFNAGLSKDKLAAIGVKLGADVPIFINSHAAFVTGIGEKINDTSNFPGLYAVLIYPNKFLSTKDVFVKFTRSFTPPSPPTPDAKYGEIGSQQNWLSFLKTKNNDLENAAIGLLPEIKAMLWDLAELEGCHFARMSGSGSTCFAIFTDKNQAETGVLSLQRKYPGAWVKLVNLVEKY